MLLKRGIFWEQTYLKALLKKDVLLLLWTALWPQVSVLNDIKHVKFIFVSDV